MKEAGPRTKTRRKDEIMSLFVQDIIKMAEKQLAAAGVDNPKGDAEALYCFLMKVDRSRFFMEWSEPAADRTCEQFFDLVARRAAREPLQYILGEQAFMDISVKTRPGVLIPRMDTETVAEKALELLDKKNDTVLEIGCGSGALSIVLAKRGAKVTASDISPEACELTKENAAKNGTKLDVVCGDLFEPVKKKKFRMIVSNPPYIRSSEIPGLMPEVRDHEPVEALDGGEDGLDFYRRLIGEADQHLRRGGRIVLEIGSDQAEDVCALLEETGKFSGIEAGKDLAGLDRVVSAVMD